MYCRNSREPLKDGLQTLEDKMHKAGIDYYNWFIISAKAFRENGDWEREVIEHVHKIEDQTGKKLDGDDPLFLRLTFTMRTDGALDVNMIGLNDETVQKMIRQAPCSSVHILKQYARLIDDYAWFVYSVDICDRGKNIHYYQTEKELEAFIERGKQIILQKTGKPFPQDSLTVLLDFLRTLTHDPEDTICDMYCREVIFTWNENDYEGSIFYENVGCENEDFSFLYCKREFFLSGEVPPKTYSDLQIENPILYRQVKKIKEGIATCFHGAGKIHGDVKLLGDTVRVVAIWKSGI